MSQREKVVKRRLDPVLEALKGIVEDLTEAIGPECEVVLHDFKDLRRSIVAIGGNVTERHIGGPPTDLLLQLVHEERTNKNPTNYRTKTGDGKTLRSSTLFIKDTEGRVIGSLCINYDITYLVHFDNWLNKFCSTSDGGPANDGSVENFAQNIEDVLHTAIDRAITSVSVPIPSMQKKDRMKVVRMLDEMGVFMIKSSVKHAAKQLGVSRDTIYTYLDDIRTPEALRIHQPLDIEKETR